MQQTCYFVLVVPVLQGTFIVQLRFRHCLSLNIAIRSRLEALLSRCGNLAVVKIPDVALVFLDASVGFQAPPAGTRPNAEGQPLIPATIRFAHWDVALWEAASDRHEGLHLLLPGAGNMKLTDGLARANMSPPKSINKLAPPPAKKRQPGLDSEGFRVSSSKNVSAESCTPPLIGNLFPGRMFCSRSNWN